MPRPRLSPTTRCLVRDAHGGLLNLRTHLEADRSRQCEFPELNLQVKHVRSAHS